MEKQEQIKTLLNMNWSYRAIEKATGIRRETISKYDHRKTAKVPTDEDSTPANCPPGSKSTDAWYHTEIDKSFKYGLSAQRIYQDLITIHNAENVSYDAIKRYVDVNH